MGLKNKSKVSSEFSMSSLTDIIFLLLIFFMLTSAVVAPNALNLKTSGDRISSPPVEEKLNDVSINHKGEILVNDNKVSEDQLDVILKELKKEQSKNMTISPKKGAPTESVVVVMDAMRRLGINGILVIEED